MNVSYDWYETPEFVYIIFYLKANDQNLFTYAITDNKFISPFLSFTFREQIKDHTLLRDKYKVQVRVTKNEHKRWVKLYEHEDIYKIGKFDFDYEEEREEETDIGNFFTKLYSNANDNVKRAMDKSISESKGTVLTTCWSDVENCKIEPVTEYVEDKLNGRDQHKCAK